MLVISELGKTTRNHVAIPPFSLTVEPGSSVAMVCTKEASSLLMQILLGRDTASTGAIHIHDQRWPKRPDSRTAAFVLHDEKLMPKLRTGEYLTYWHRLAGSEIDLQNILTLTGLQQHASSPIGRLDESQQKLLQLARSIVQDPDVLILEDPGQNMDRESLARLKAMIDFGTDCGKLVLITASSAELAEALGNRRYRLTAEGLAPDEEASPGNRGYTHLGQPERAKPIEQLFDIGKIPAKNEDSIILFNAPEINYVESSAGASLLYVDGQAYPCALNMTQLEKKLMPFGFYRCHRSYLVNLQQVREIEAWTKESYILKLNNDHRSKIPLSKNKFNELKDQLGL